MQEGKTLERRTAFPVALAQIALDILLIQSSLYNCPDAAATVAPPLSKLENLCESCCSE